MRSCNPIHAKLAASQLLSAVISANAVHELSITFSKKLHMQQSLLNHSLLRNEPVSLDQWNQPQLPTQNLRRSIDHEMAQSNKIIITRDVSFLWLLMSIYFNCCHPVVNVFISFVLTAFVAGLAHIFRVLKEWLFSTSLVFSSWGQE